MGMLSLSLFGVIKEYILNTIYLLFKLDIESHGLPRDTGAVVNLAGCLLMDPSKRCFMWYTIKTNTEKQNDNKMVCRWNEDFKRQLRESRIMTTSLLRDAIKASSNPPKVFVGSSAVGKYPPGSGSSGLEPGYLFLTDIRIFVIVSHNFVGSLKSLAAWE